MKSGIATLLLILMPAFTADGAGKVSDAEGRVLGTLLSADLFDTMIVTSTGFLVAISRDGILGQRDGAQLAYVGHDCQGGTFLRHASYTGTVLRAGNTSSDEVTTVYVPHDAEALRLEDGAPYSYYMFYYPPDQPGLFGCFNTTSSPDYPVTLTPAFPNDPATTGIGNGPFPMPLVFTPDRALLSGFERSAH